MDSEPRPQGMFDLLSEASNLRRCATACENLAEGCATNAEWFSWVPRHRHETPTMTIKAIETHYASCRFRSRLEARWAVFFDTANIPWRYEPEGFELSTGRYLPDFFLPTCSTWIEVKGDEERVDPVQLTTAALELPVIKGTGEIGPRLMVLGPIHTPSTGAP